jgi:hypothetical protein
MRAALRAAGDAMCVATDSGLGMKAIAAVAALPRGPRRELELELWVRRFETFGGPIALPITGDTTDAELAALVDLRCAMAGVP